MPPWLPPAICIPEYEDSCGKGDTLGRKYVPILLPGEGSSFDGLCLGDPGMTTGGGAGNLILELVLPNPAVLATCPVNTPCDAATNLPLPCLARTLVG